MSYFTGESHCHCPCSTNESYSANDNRKELIKTLEPKLKLLETELKVEKAKLSSTRNRLNSKLEDRTSAQSIGYIAIAVLCIVGASIVLADLTSWKQKKTKQKSR